MPVTYNLRSSQRKREPSNRNCYLKHYLENCSPEAFNPRVCLERLKFLESNNIHTSRFYIDKDGITIKKNRPNVSIKMCFLKFFSIILLALCLLYCREEIKCCGITMTEKISEFYPVIQNYYSYAINLHQNYIQFLLHKEQRTSIAKSGFEELIDFSLKSKEDEFEIINFVKENFVQLKNNIEFANGVKTSKTFIEEQCKAEDGDNFKTFFNETNLIDYALQSLGAEIVSVFKTEPYGTKTVKFLDFDVWAPLGHFLLKTSKYFNTNGPNSVLMPWKKPGDCWAFKGSQGRVQIKLSEKIFITAITIDHVPKNTTFDGNIESAPKKFSVFGVEEPGTPKKGKFMGTYEYNSAGPASQTFLVHFRQKIPFRWIEISIESNHGNENYTCVYKIRVHGHK